MISHFISSEPGFWVPVSSLLRVSAEAVAGIPSPLGLNSVAGSRPVGLKPSALGLAHALPGVPTL